MIKSIVYHHATGKERLPVNTQPVSEEVKLQLVFAVPEIVKLANAKLSVIRQVKVRPVPTIV